MTIKSRVLPRAGGRPYRLDLGVSGGIMAGKHCVYAGGDNLAVFYQHRAKGTAFPGLNVVKG
jgi:hypothetical protein